MKARLEGLGGKVSIATQIKKFGGFVLALRSSLTQDPAFLRERDFRERS